MENEVWLFYENLKAISFIGFGFLNFKQYEFEKDYIKIKN